MERNLKYTTIYTLKAENDIIETYTWYEHQQKGLGTRYVESVRRRINKIEQNPEIFSAKYKSYREAGVPRFPFVIIYRINKRRKIIRIFSIFHTAQNPAKKYK